MNPTHSQYPDDPLPPSTVLRGESLLEASQLVTKLGAMIGVGKELKFGQIAPGDVPAAAPGAFGVYVGAAGMEA